MPEIPLCAVSTRTSSYRFQSESRLLPFACALPRKGAAPAVLPCWMADCASLWETGGAGLIRLGGRVSRIGLCLARNPLPIRCCSRPNSRPKFLISVRLAPVRPIA